MISCPFRQAIAEVEAGQVQTVSQDLAEVLLGISDTSEAAAAAAHELSELRVQSVNGERLSLPSSLVPNFL